MAGQRTFDQRTAWVVAFVIFAVAFGILRFGVGYSAGAALIVAVLLGLLAGVVGWIAFGGKRAADGAADEVAVTPAKDVEAPVAAAPAPMPTPEEEPKSHRASLMMGEAGHALRQEMARRVGAPAALSDPRNGQADDLTEIKGIGPKLQDILNDLGIYHFDQIAAWSDEERQWVDENLRGFRGRASRDNWIGQARALVTGAGTGGQP